MEENLANFTISLAIYNDIGKLNKLSSIAMLIFLNTSHSKLLLFTVHINWIRIIKLSGQYVTTYAISACFWCFKYSDGDGISDSKSLGGFNDDVGSSWSSSLNLNSSAAPRTLTVKA